MTATLTFNLPEDQEEFDIANKGGAWKLAMWDFRQALREKYKHGGQESFASAELLEMINEAHRENGLEPE